MMAEEEEAEGEGPKFSTPTLMLRSPEAAP